MQLHVLCGLLGTNSQSLLLILILALQDDKTLLACLHVMQSYNKIQSLLGDVLFSKLSNSLTTGYIL